MNSSTTLNRMADGFNSSHLLNTVFIFFKNKMQNASEKRMATKQKSEKHNQNKLAKVQKTQETSLLKSEGNIQTFNTQGQKKVQKRQRQEMERRSTK